MMWLNRREFLSAGGLWLAGLTLGRFCHGANDHDVVEIYMRSSPDGAEVTFDPIGLLVRPGQRIRWVNASDNVHTATAYHPANDLHPLRIPASASPWDSGYLVNRGDSFEVILSEEGVYDYYCIPHEAAGMVGRIIVSRSEDHRRISLRPYPDQSAVKQWSEIPKAALASFPPIAAILGQGRIQAP